LAQDSDNRFRFLLLLSILIGITTVSLGTAIWMLYAASLARQQERLVVVAHGTTHLIDSVPPASPGARQLHYYESIKREISDPRSGLFLGETGEITLGWLEGDSIVLLSWNQQSARQNSPPASLPRIALTSPFAEPMKEALAGKTGTLVGLDYRGERVLAAFEPVQDFSGGLVAKIDLAEVRAPFVKAGLFSVFVVISGLSLAASFGSRASQPIIRRLVSREVSLQSFFQFAPDPFLISDYTSGKISDCNRAFELLLGYPREEIQGASLSSILPAHYWRSGGDTDIRRLIDQSRRAEDSQPLESPILAADGTVIPVEISIKFLRLQGKEWVLTIMRDISKRKAAELALVESEEKLRSLLESAADAILVISHEGQILNWNPAAERVFGYKAAEVIDQPVTKLIPAEYRKLQSEDIERFRKREWETTAGGTHEMMGLRKGEEEFPIEVSLSTWLVGNDRFYGAIIRDATERKRYERAIRESRRMLSTLMDNLPGFTPAELTGQSMTRLIHPEDRSRIWLEMQEAVGKHESFELVYRIRTKEGQERWVWEKGTGIVDTDSEPSFLEGFIGDITERQLLEEQLRQAQKMEAIGVLAGGIAHDFNNILTGILGYSELLMSQPGSESQLLDIVQIKELAERAATLVRQLLTFTRQHPARIEAVKLELVVEDTLKMLTRVIGEDISIRWTKPEDIPFIDADYSQLQQVLLNLAVNARDAMHRGGVLEIELETVILETRLCLSTGLLEPGRYARLLVRDSGSGMEEPVRNRIFEPFFTTKELGRGTGLGLALVHAIVRQHGGQIQVESSPQSGTTFEIYFPIRESKQKHPVAAAADVRSTSGSETILLVEDEADIRRLVSRILSPLGYTILKAECPEAAFKLFEQHSEQLDLLLTDVVLPGQNGPELFERLAADKPSLKVLYFSGYSQANAQGREPRQDLKPFLHKPFTVGSLTAAVRNALDGNGDRTDVASSE
jgi:PAS domain S-box-containing protein